ncbi:MAG: RHS repeat-associated core domain-containing protein [Candidatus Omnitrophica bacterium]|nr:RHS repeat-associated core domain-containing protein [Candidatus Omnitrophota bacterium]
MQTDGDDLLFMRARYYKPSVGRFINKDPIGLAGGINLYGYVGGNVVNLIDPMGLRVVPSWVVDGVLGGRLIVVYIKIKWSKETGEIVEKIGICVGKDEGYMGWRLWGFTSIGQDKLYIWYERYEVYDRIPYDRGTGNQGNFPGGCMQ